MPSPFVRLQPSTFDMPCAILTDHFDHLAIQRWRNLRRIEDLSFVTAASTSNYSPAVGSESNGPAWLGIAFRDVRVPAHGGQSLRVVVVEVRPNGPAANAGVQPGDFILSVQGRSTTRAQSLVQVLREQRPGSRVAIGLLRGKQFLDLSVTLGTMPTSMAQNGRNNLQKSWAPRGLILNA